MRKQQQRQTQLNSAPIFRQSNVLWALILTFSLLFLGACTTPEKLFQASPSGASHDNKQIFQKPQAPILKVGDKLSISVWGHEDLSIGSVNSSFNSNESTGRWLILNDEGEANLPKLGRVKLTGLTVKEAGYQLEQRYAAFIQNPIVNIKVLNHYVTILGEINNVGKYNFDNESMTLIQLIGTAKGLTPYAKNQQVEVIRTIDSITYKQTTDLSQLVSLNTQNIYLQPDDIIYIAPSKNKEIDNRLAKATLIGSFLTSAAVVASIFLK